MRRVLLHAGMNRSIRYVFFGKMLRRTWGTIRNAPLSTLYAT